MSLAPHWRFYTEQEVVSMKAKDIMTKDPATVTPNTTVREAARLMQQENTGILPVIQDDSKRLLGVITDRDIAIRVVAEGRDPDTAVGDVMSKGQLVALQPDADVEDAMDKMASEQVRRIPIVDERGTLHGIVSQADIVRKAGDDLKAERTVEKISEPSRRHAQ
jgi:CBS domain-containing protein